MKKLNLLILISVAIVVSIFLSLILRTKQNRRSLTTNYVNEEVTFTTFKATGIMNFTIQVSNSFRVNDQADFVELVDLNNRGTISIARNGTNFNNLSDYLDDLSVKNKFSLESKKDVTINDLDAIITKIGGKRYCFIYVDGVVYTFSTEVVDLFDDLDQIAQSFRYTPD